MNDSEMKNQIIDAYVNLKRLKAAEDKEKELARQEAILKMKLQALGIPTEELDKVL